MKVLRKIIEIDEELCNGCGECVPACAEGALEIVEGKARMIAEKYCDGLGACLGDCPTGALRIVEREADDFDEEAVEELLKTKKQEAQTGCPSKKIEMFKATDTCSCAEKPIAFQAGPISHSALSHWPVQIRLVPPEAPFLKNADLLVAADCTPIAYPDFHRDFLKGRTILLGCPKFDDSTAYARKFADIFRKADIKSLTILIMEVPCCGTMRGIIREALKMSGREIPVQEIVVSVRGQILENREWAKAV